MIIVDPAIYSVYIYIYSFFSQLESQLFVESQQGPGSVGLPASHGEGECNAPCCRRDGQHLPLNQEARFASTASDHGESWSLFDLSHVDFCRFFANSFHQKRVNHTPPPKKLVRTSQICTAGGALLAVPEVPVASL